MDIFFNSISYLFFNYSFLYYLISSPFFVQIQIPISIYFFSLLSYFLLYYSSNPLILILHFFCLLLLIYLFCSFLPKSIIHNSHFFIMRNYQLIIIEMVIKNLLFDLLIHKSLNYNYSTLNHITKTFLYSCTCFR
jgi:hypothetical protein